jgi:hypothetical protein
MHLYKDGQKYLFSIATDKFQEFSQSFFRQQKMEG